MENHELERGTSTRKLARPSLLISLGKQKTQAEPSVGQQWKKLLTNGGETLAEKHILFYSTTTRRNIGKKLNCEP